MQVRLALPLGGCQQADLAFSTEMTRETDHLTSLLGLFIQAIGIYYIYRPTTYRPSSNPQRNRAVSSSEETTDFRPIYQIPNVCPLGDGQRMSLSVECPILQVGRIMIYKRR